MSFSSWLRRKLKHTNKKRRTTLTRRLSMEPLEDRVLLSTWSGNVFDGVDGSSGPLWKNTEVQKIIGNVTVPAGKTLTVQPGTVVQFNSGLTLTVNGTLTAAGTTAQQIFFTSYRDNSPTGGSNGAGQGDWGAITFNPGSAASLLDHVEVRYGGYAGGTLPGEIIASGPLTLSNSVLRDSYNAGLRVAGSSPTVTGVTFQNNYQAVSMDLASSPVIIAPTVQGNTFNSVVVDSGSIAGNVKWNGPGIFYRLNGNVTVPAGATLEVDAGQTVQFNNTSLTVNGKLKAAGTATAPVTFTSYRDNSALGGSNNAGAGDWGALIFNPGSDASSLDQVLVRYGGYANDTVEAAVVVGANITVNNSTISNSYNGGVRILQSNPTFTNDTWKDNLERFNASAYALRMDLASSPVIINPTFQNNEINGVLLDAGNLPASIAWDNPDVVYVLSNNLTVPAGSTLTIAPGKVVKFDNNHQGGVSLLVSGTLHAAGMAAAPIIFTSRQDDTAGGDTNNDGSFASSQGDWGAIQFGSGSSDNLIDHAELRFAGFDDAPGFVGAIMLSGSLTLSNSIVRDTSRDGIVVNPGASATLKSNVIVRNHLAGVHAQAGATLTAVNNTVDGNSYGFQLDSPVATLTNNLVTNNVTGILLTGPTSPTMSFNDVCNRGLFRADYSGLPDQTGTNGNISVDPKYFNPTNLSYQLRPGSPVEDAGTSTGAPTTDFFGNVLFMDPNISGRGNGSGKDMGAIEVQQVATSNIDLATFNVSGPTTGGQGMNATVTWIVRSVGTEGAMGSWSDAVYLSDTPFWTPDARLLTRVQHTGDLGPGQSYTGTANVTLNDVLPGNHYFLVRTNDLNDVFEGLATANNASASQPISFAMPTLTLNTPFSDQFTGSGQAKYYQITVAAGQTLSFALQSAATSGSTELYVSRGSVPSRSRFDFTGSSALSPSQQVIVPTTQPGTYYVLAYAAYGSSAGSAYTLTAGAAAFGVQGVSPSTASNAGQVTLTIHGSLLTANTQPSLVAPDNSMIPPLATQFVDATTLQATFDLISKATGSYGVLLTQGAQTVNSPGALTVTTGNLGHLSVDFVVPGGIRAGQLGTVTVNYTNDGGADLSAPVLVVTSSVPTLRFTSDTSSRGDAVEFLAINPTGPAGVLPPGARGSISLYFVASVNVTSSDFTLKSQSTELNSQPLDWSAAKTKLQPLNVPADAWNAIYANFMADVGTTLGSFQTLLDRNATYLSRLGEYTASEGNLLALEFQQAGAFGAITQRYTLGAFGYGFPDPTAVKAMADASGNVTILSGTSQRTFLIQPDHGYHGASGDLGVLTVQNGAYRLQEANGTRTVFRTDGRLDYTQDRNDNRLTAEYTGTQLTRFTDSFGNTTTFSYNGQGRIRQVTDPVGRVTTYTYDSGGQHLLSITNPQGTTQFTYVTGQGAAREHAVQSVTYPDGTHTFFTYDSRGRLSKTTADGGANAVDYTYEGPGGITATDAQQASTTTLFNAFGQPGLVQDALGNVTHYLYDSSHNLIKTVRPDGSTVLVNPDNRNNPAMLVDPLGHQINASFDPVFGTLQSLTAPRGNTLSFRTDAHGNRLTTAYPNGSLKQFTYDVAGNVTTQTDRAGNKFTYTYDAHNLLVREDLSDGTSATFTYDTHRNLTTATNAAGTTTYSYDLPTDRLMQVTYPDGRFLKFTYDSAGRRAQSLDQSGFTVHYTYDASGRLQGLTDASNAPIVTYTYNSVGRLQRQDMGNGTFTTYSYDAAGQVKSLSNYAPGGSVISQFDYTYDALGNVLTMSTAGATTSYGYDASGQLTSASLPGGRTITYQYDATGNRVGVTDGGTTTSYTANNMNQYTTVGSAQFTYDDNGNLISRQDSSGTTIYTYNLQGQLVSVTTPTDSFSYVYDALGTRTAVIQNGVRTSYLVDPTGLGNVVAEYGASGQLVAHYTYGASLTSRVDATSSTAYFAFDAHGNTSAITASNGSVANTYSYLPFGETLTQTGSLPNVFTFAGQFGVMSEENGLYFMRARYYASNLGQFISEDPIGLAGGDVNLRRYVGNNPITRIDPAGLTGGEVEAIEKFVVSTLGNAAATEASDLNDVANGKKKTGGDVVEDIARGLVGVEGLPTAGNAINFAADNPRDTINGAYQVVHEKDRFEELQAISRGTDTSIRKPQRQSGQTPEVNAVANPVPTANGTRTLEKSKELGLDNSDERITIPILTAVIDFFTPLDPNDLSGPLGFGSSHFVTPDQTFPYTILFENLPTATAPALVVQVVQQLDAKLDWTTFELGDFGFGPYTVHVPAGRRFFSTRVDATGTRGEYVDITASFDPSIGKATWTYSSVDPKTGVLPTGVTDGFLPPDDSTGSGEGFVTYRVRPKPGAASGTAINAKATVYFDAGLPDQSSLDTPQFTNTIDAGGPISSVTALPASSPATFTVSWSGTDDAGGSGIATFDIFVSDNGGPFASFQTGTAATSASFTGIVGHTYGFYSVATDNLGHRQATPSAAQATTQVNVNTPPVLATIGDKAVLEGTQLSFTISGSDSDVPAQTLTYSTSGLPGGATFDAATRTFKWTPTHAQVGTSSVTFTVTDGSLTDSKATKITVNAAPAPSVPGVLQFSAAHTDVQEDKGAVMLTVQRAGGSDGTVEVQFTISVPASFILKQRATPGQDFSGSLTGKLSFATGETNKTVSIPITNDDLVEDTETFVVTLSSPTGGATLGSTATVQINILDDDLPQVPNKPVELAILQSAANGFGKSVEHYRDFVRKAYERFLGRQPDEAGFIYWVTLMQLYETSQHQQGLRQEQIEAGFLDSPEYLGRYGGVGEAWIRGIYKDLLQREADKAGVDYWLAQLQQNVPPTAVALGFTASDERLRSRVADTYRTLLDREADAAGLAYWVAIFKGGGTTEDIVSGFVGSPEYYNKPNRGGGNPAQWTREAYLDVLFRPANTNEFGYWLNSLNG